MTRSPAATRVLPQPGTVGALMLGAALALVPLSGHAQDAPSAPAAAESAPAAAMTNASPGADTAGQAAAPAAEGDTGAPSAEAAAAGGDTGATGALRQAGATLRNAEGADVGSVVLTQTESGVLHVILDIPEGALPTAQHGFHIHETGACEGPDFKSAGGHLASGKEHGVHSANGPHPGDLPNITMGAAGALHVEYFLPGVLMDQIVDQDGAAVMIHSGVDDYTSQPAGNAGDRIACGVIDLTR